jgi:hypothetical protein
MGSKGIPEFLPSDNMIGQEHGEIIIPPKKYGTVKLLHGETDLILIITRYQKYRKLGFNGANPSAGVQWFLHLVKQKGLSVQKILIARNQRLVDIVPTPLMVLLLLELLKCLLPLDKLTEQFSLVNHHSSHVGR